MANVPIAPLVLLRNLGASSPKGPALHALFEGAGVGTRVVDDSELAESVGYLAGIPSFSPALKTGATMTPLEDTLLSEEFVLFCHMPDNRVMELVRTMRAAGISIGCKAMLTEHNQSWPFVRLIQEVSEEHATMTRLRQAANNR